MKILVCNIGSTSFKFRLFRLGGPDGQERELAHGGADRIGRTGGVMTWRISPMAAVSRNADFTDHGQAIAHVLVQLVAGGALARTDDLAAVAFKAVMAGDTDPVALVDDALLARMEYFTPVAPAHNPPYIAAMRMFRKVLTGTPLVAAFEPGFHRTVPQRRRLFAVPPEWADKFGVKRYGFHGASHAYIAQRTAELMGWAKPIGTPSDVGATPWPAGRGQGVLATDTPCPATRGQGVAPGCATFTAGGGCATPTAEGGCATRLISCHLGGSSSICAIRDGRSVATSMGLSPQSGLPQSNRAGDFDVFALALLKKQTGMDADAVLAALGSCGGLAALSGTSGDMRDIRAAARNFPTDYADSADSTNKNESEKSVQSVGKSSGAGDGPAHRARLTIELFVTAIRDFVGSYLVELGGADALVFTGGIGQNDPELRAEVCAGLDFAGIKLDAGKNAAAQSAEPPGESRVESSDSKTAIWVMPTNEELIVARQAAEFLGVKD